MEIVDHVIVLFGRFVKERMNECYHFDDANLYQGAEKNDGDQVFLNPFLKTEHDLAMKFGGFMEEVFLDEKFIQKHGRITVHAEIGLYHSGRDRADMSIHRCDDGLWKTRDDIINSTLAVIEIKGFGYRKPEKYCDVKRMTDDIGKFERLGAPENAAKIMIIIDGSVAGGRLRTDIETRYADIVQAAYKKRVTLLSNNPKLNSRNTTAAQSIV